MNIIDLHTLHTIYSAYNILEELGPILLKFFKFYLILVSKCSPYFSHNLCEILQPKHVLFWRYR